MRHILLVNLFLSFGVYAQDFSVLMKQEIDTISELPVLLESNNLKTFCETYKERKLLYGVKEYYCGSSNRKMFSILLYNDVIFQLKNMSLFSEETNSYDSSLESQIQQNSGVEKVAFINAIKMLDEQVDVREYSRKPSLNPLWDAITNKNIDEISKWLYSYDPDVILTAYYSLTKVEIEWTDDIKSRVEFLKQYEELLIPFEGEQKTFKEIFEILDLGGTWR